MLLRESSINANVVLYYCNKWKEGVSSPSRTNLRDDVSAIWGLQSAHVMERVVRIRCDLFEEIYSSRVSTCTWSRKRFAIAFVTTNESMSSALIFLSSAVSRPSPTCQPSMGSNTQWLKVLNHGKLFWGWLDRVLASKNVAHTFDGRWTCLCFTCLLHFKSDVKWTPRIFSSWTNSTSGMIGGLHAVDLAIQRCLHLR